MKERSEGFMLVNGEVFPPERDDLEHSFWPCKTDYVPVPAREPTNAADGPRIEIEGRLESTTIYWPGAGGSQVDDLWIWLVAEIVEIRRNLAELVEEERLMRPILAISEAASLIGKSEKRLVNIITELQSATGRRPDWVVDAGGVMNRMVDRERFIQWVSTQPKRRGRPCKNERR